MNKKGMDMIAIIVVFAGVLAAVVILIAVAGVVGGSAESGEYGSMMCRFSCVLQGQSISPAGTEEREIRGEHKPEPTTLSGKVDPEKYCGRDKEGKRVDIKKTGEYIHTTCEIGKSCGTNSLIVVRNAKFEEGDSPPANLDPESLYRGYRDTGGYPDSKIADKVEPIVTNPCVVEAKDGIGDIADNESYCFKYRAAEGVSYVQVCNGNCDCSD